MTKAGPSYKVFSASGQSEKPEVPDDVVNTYMTNWGLTSPKGVALPDMYKEAVLPDGDMRELRLDTWEDGGKKHGALMIIGGKEPFRCDHGEIIKHDKVSDPTGKDVVVIEGTYIKTLTLECQLIVETATPAVSPSAQVAKPVKPASTTSKKSSAGPAPSKPYRKKRLADDEVERLYALTFHRVCTRYQMGAADMTGLSYKKEHAEARRAAVYIMSLIPGKRGKRIGMIVRPESPNPDTAANSHMRDAREIYKKSKKFRETVAAICTELGIPLPGSEKKSTPSPETPAPAGKSAKVTIPTKPSTESGTLAKPTMGSCTLASLSSADLENLYMLVLAQAGHQIGHIAAAFDADPTSISFSAGRILFLLGDQGTALALKVSKVKMLAEKSKQLPTELR